MSATLIIRAARTEDASALAAIRNLPEVRRGTLALPFRSVAETETYIAGLGANAYLLVAERSGVVAGSASLNRYTGRRAHVGSIGIMVADPDHGQGIGTALLAALLDLADNWLGLTRLELTVFADNNRAIALYQRLGFVQEGHLRDYALRDGALADSLSMARLRPPIAR
jgi:putative acetyltransferase